MKKLLYQGSVKNIYSCHKDIEFEFTDQYSVFDWGVMPDTIHEKGKYLAKTAALLFQILERAESYQNLPKPSALSEEHFSAILESKSFSELIKFGAKTHYQYYLPPNRLGVSKFEVPKIQQENTSPYAIYEKKPTQTLIPLEVIFRFGAPTGSSYIKRFPKTEPNSFFSDIVIEFSTKLEEQDRMLSYEEAKQISGIEEEEFQILIDKTKAYALVLNTIFSSNNFQLWDGKLEFAFGEKKEQTREIVLVDSIGPDEIRLTKNQQIYSKEFLRKQYENSQWKNELSEVKKSLQSFSKNQFTHQPHHLSNDVLLTAENIYRKVYETVLYFFQGSKKSSVIIFGKGGREHALAHHIAKDPFVKKVFIIPGNPGMKGEKIFCHSIAKEEVISFCQEQQIDFALIGPENLLEEGLADQLRENHIPCFGPTKNAAKLESSKAYAKNLMKKYGIPTADYHTFQDAELAKNFISQSKNDKFVVKLSALAAGKGVILCDSKDGALDAIKTLSPNNEEIVIEDYLKGKELSYFALCQEENFATLGTACDYKRLKDGDKGPNTGGMGCYSPCDFLSENDHHEIRKQIISPTLEAMKKEGTPFNGVLFIGIMMTSQGPKVIEFNVRFGDPETQTILPRLQTSLVPILKVMSAQKSTQEQINLLDISLGKNASVHVVKAAKGYPGTNGEKVQQGQTIERGSVKIKDKTTIYYAGVKLQANNLVTNGGRVLGVTAIGENKLQAKDIVYSEIQNISFAGEQYRKDIAK